MKFQHILGLKSNEDKLTKGKYLYLSTFYNQLKYENKKPKLLKKKQYNLIKHSEQFTMGTIVMLWFEGYISYCKKKNMDEDLKNCVMRDFLDSLYLYTESFDEVVFPLLYSSCKVVVKLDDKRNLKLNFSKCHETAKQILQYALMSKITYFDKRSELRQTPIDYSLNNISSCHCLNNGRPLYVALLDTKPLVVHELLNCGARIYYEDECSCGRSSRHPIIKIMMLHMFIIRRQNFTSRFAQQIAKKLLACLLLLTADLQSHSIIRREIIKVLNIFLLHRLDYLPKLKFMCRTALRSALKMSHNICKENVWRELNLPESLVSYMKIRHPVMFEPMKK